MRSEEAGLNLGQRTDADKGQFCDCLVRPSNRMRMAEVDGNRTRRTRITRPNRFEGGGAHQVLVHLRGGSCRGRRPRGSRALTGTVDPEAVDSNRA